MAEFPFDIPKSLSTYVEQFDEDPIKVTTKLKNQLNRRGADAVGYFLLAWFYHLKGMKDQAVENALAAKIYAPGSPLMEKLHYYLSHPDTFKAWIPDSETASPSQKYHVGEGPEPVLNLDHLIERLSSVESGPVGSSDGGSDSFTPSFQFDADALDVDDIASETLANIHEIQGKTEAAIRTYKRLKKLNKDKKEFYKEQISRLKKLRDEQQGDDEEE